jgi:hypothetical protein
MADAQMRMEIILADAAAPNIGVERKLNGIKHSPKWWQYTETANGTYEYDCIIGTSVFYKKGNWVLEVSKGIHPLCKDYVTYHPALLAANTESNGKPLVFINDKNDPPYRPHTYMPLQCRRRSTKALAR